MAMYYSLPIHKRVWRKFISVVKSHFVFCIKATSKTNTNNNGDVHHHQQPQASVPEMKDFYFPKDRRIMSVEVEAIWNKGKGAVEVSDVHNNNNNDGVMNNAGESSSNSDATEMKLEGIDARAEEFINNFKQHLRIQRAMSAENAILEFYQMLARSA